MICVTADRRPSTVLVVEDQAHTAEKTEVMLTEIDVQTVRIAASFEEAEQLLAYQSFDLAILDFNMGEAASWSIAKTLCNRGIHIIVTTTQDNLVLPASCTDAPLLMKPYTLNELAALVESSARPPTPGS
jgi:DNA-binding response OmpR family regulator